MKNIFRISLLFFVLALFYPAKTVFAMSINLSASPPSNGFITIAWNTNPPAAHCLFGPGQGGGGASGFINVYPKTATTYTITCQSPSYTETVQASIQVSPSGTPNATQSTSAPTPTPTPYNNNNQQPQYPQQQQNTNVTMQIINVACATEPLSPKVGGKVTFAAAASGGLPPYTFNWSGAVSGNTQSIDTSFTTTGVKSAIVVARDAYGYSGQTSCSVNVASGASPTPTPAPTRTQTPTPTPTGKVEGAATVCKQVNICFDQNTGKITETPVSPGQGGQATIPTPTANPTSAQSASSAPAVSSSKNKNENASPSFLATVFNVKGDVWGKIKSLVVWYIVILLIILLIVLSYMGVKKMKTKKAAAKERKTATPPPNLPR